MSVCKDCLKCILLTAIYFTYNKIILNILYNINYFYLLQVNDNYLILRTKYSVFYITHNIFLKQCIWVITAFIF